MKQGSVPLNYASGRNAALGYIHVFPIEVTRYREAIPGDSDFALDSLFFARYNLASLTKSDEVSQYCGQYGIRESQSIGYLPFPRG